MKTRVSSSIPTLTPLEHGANAIAIEVYYDKGGANYFSGGYDRRGYWLSVTPVKQEDGSTSFIIGSAGGRRFFVEQAARFSAKRLEELAGRLHAHDTIIAANCIAQNFDSIRTVVTESLRERVPA